MFQTECIQYANSIIMVIHPKETKPDICFWPLTTVRLIETMFSHKCVSLCQLLGGLYIIIMASGMRFVSGMELLPSITLAMSIAHKSYKMKTQSNISHENGPFDMKIQPRYVHWKAINQLNNSNHIVIDLLLLVTLVWLKCNQELGCIFSLKLKL